MILQILHGLQKFDETTGEFYFNFVEKSLCFELLLLPVSVPFFIHLDISFYFILFSGF